jgi:hypothetical protein
MRKIECQAQSARKVKNLHGFCVSRSPIDGSETSTASIDAIRIATRRAAPRTDAVIASPHAARGRLSA